MLLKGKLTYTIAAITAIWAIVGFFLGNLDATSAGQMLLASIAAFGVRRAIT